jgi:hypothetical protein
MPRYFGVLRGVRKQRRTSSLKDIEKRIEEKDD